MERDDMLNRIELLERECEDLRRVVMTLGRYTVSPRPDLRIMLEGYLDIYGSGHGENYVANPFASSCGRGCGMDCTRKYMDCTRKYFVKKHYPGWCAMCDPGDGSEEGWFSTKAELEAFPFVKSGEGYHVEIGEDGSIPVEGSYCLYVMAVKDDLTKWHVNGIVSGLDEFGVRVIKTWYPEWKFERMNREA